MRVGALPRCFQNHERDNVATMLDDADTGSALVIAQEGSLTVREKIPMGHKVAVKAIPAGTPIVKFGVPIGRASENIEAGAWVHLHNCASNYDQRSQTLDVRTGAATDTAYE